MSTDQNSGTTVLDEAYLHRDSQMRGYTHLPLLLEVLLETV